MGIEWRGVPWVLGSGPRTKKCRVEERRNYLRLPVAKVLAKGSNKFPRGHDKTRSLLSGFRHACIQVDERQSGSGPGRVYVCDLCMLFSENPNLT